MFHSSVARILLLSALYFLPFSSSLEAVSIGCALKLRFWKARSFVNKFPLTERTAGNSQNAIHWIEFIRRISGQVLAENSSPRILKTHYHERGFRTAFIVTVEIDRRPKLKIPRMMTLSPYLIQGWKMLGLINENNRFNFKATPDELLERFERISAWTVIRPEERGPLESHLEFASLLSQKKILVSDLHDYIFHLGAFLIPAIGEFAQLAGEFERLVKNDSADNSPLNFTIEQRTNALKTPIFGPIPWINSEPEWRNEWRFQPERKQRLRRSLESLVSKIPTANHRLFSTSSLQNRLDSHQLNFIQWPEYPTDERMEVEDFYGALHAHTQADPTFFNDVHLEGWAALPLEGPEDWDIAVLRMQLQIAVYLRVQEIRGLTSSTEFIEAQQWMEKSKAVLAALRELRVSN